MTHGAQRTRTRLLLAVLLAGLFAGIPALTHPAAAAVPGLQTVVASSPTDSNPSKTATAICPGAKVVIGTGADLLGAGQSQVVILIAPAGANAIRVSAYEDDSGYALNWTVRAWAICANPLPGLQIVTGLSAVNSLSPKGATAVCPAGKQVIGTAGTVSGGTGQVRMNMIWPSSTGVSVRAYEDETGYAGNWAAVAVAYCANPLPGYQIVTATGPVNVVSPPTQTLLARCPLGKHVLGIGAGVTAPVAALGQVGLTGLIKSAADAVTVNAAEDDTGFVSNWTIMAAAICAIP